MKCSLCGRGFIEREAEQACKSCPMAKGCKLVKCPNCGFETPLEPKWLKYFKKERERDEDKR